MRDSRCSTDAPCSGWWDWGVGGAGFDTLLPADLCAASGLCRDQVPLKDKHLSTLDVKYQKKVFAPLSSNPEKVTTEAKMQDAKPMFSSTWGYYS